MDGQMKERWLDALRSGRYEQGTGQLRNGNHYCCLGVLCDLIDPSRWAQPKGLTEYDWGTAHTLLPLDHSSHLGLRAATRCLMHMNDDDGKSFAEIADWIEENL